ncbi:MAG: hypothetical protein SNH27_12060 [Rikenellaceae bacterium]
MEDIVKYVISAIGGAGAIAGLFIWLGKKWIDKRVALELDNHKEELKRITNELQEKLRIEYGSLYQERIKAIQSLYSLICDIEEKTSYLNNQLQRYNTSGDFCHNDPIIVDGEVQNLIKIIDNWLAIFDKARIYFSNNNTTYIGKLTDVYVGFKNNYKYYEEQEIGDPIDDYRVADIWYFLDRELHHLISDETIENKRNIENMFRNLVGVKNE